MSTNTKREDYDASPTSNSPKRERRSRDRVTDEQGTGHGSKSALSKLKMLERHRAVVTPRRSDDY